MTQGYPDTKLMTRLPKMKRMETELSLYNLLIDLIMYVYFVGLQKQGVVMQWFIEDRM